MDDDDEEELAKYERYRTTALSALPHPVVSGTTLVVEDTSQDLTIKIVVNHAILDPEEVPAGFVLSGSVEAQTSSSGASGTGSDGATLAPSVGAKRALDSGEVSATDDAGNKRSKAETLVVDDDDAICLD